MKNEPPKPSCSILLAEDCDETRELLAGLLEEMGYSVATAECAGSCIDRALDAWHAGRPFDVILMDIGLPDVDGCSAAIALRKEGYDHPIIAITASPSMNKRRISVHSGCDEFLAKLTLAETIEPALSHLARKSLE